HKFNIQGFYTQTLRSGYLEQGKRITLSPRTTSMASMLPSETGASESCG
ncbi:hypothetical protein IBK40_28055, partial [Escherichia coli]|nr:hypothetical protein [Escherichia coli]